MVKGGLLLLWAIILLCGGSCSKIRAFKLTSLATGLAFPVQMRFDPANPGQFYVAELRGRILPVVGSRPGGTPLLDLRTVTSPAPADGGEVGLKSFAFHPRYGENGRVFVMYTRG